MNKMKKFASIATAVLMTACMAAPMTISSFAATDATPQTPAADNTDPIVNDGTNDAQKNKIVIKNAIGTGHTYKAYKIFGGTVSGSNDNKTLTDVSWGSSKIETAVKTINEDDLNLTNVADANAAMAAIKTYMGTQGKTAAGLGDLLGKAIKGANITDENVVASTTSGGTEGEINIEKTGNGWYLIIDEAPSTSQTGDTKSYSAYILGTVDATKGAEIDAKSGAPTVMKKVQEGSLIGGTDETTSFAGNTTYPVGDGYNDIADYNIGDTVPFRLYGTLPSNIGDYKAYKYVFHDTLSNKFTPVTTVANGTLPDVTVKIKIGTDEYGIAKNDTTGYKLEADGTDDNNHKFKVTFDDIKSIKLFTLSDGKVSSTEANLASDGENSRSVPNAEELATAVITVDYSAKLNSTAVVGLSGQDNAVKLEYSNNPEAEGSGTTSETPPDKSRVYTYGFKFDKTFATGTDSPVTDDELNKWTTDLNNSETNKNTSIQFKLKTDDKTATDNNTVYVVPATGTDADEWDYVVAKKDDENATSTIGLFAHDGDITDHKLSVKIKGLDRDTYYLDETRPPEGYNAVSNVKVEITADEITTQTWDNSTDTLEEFTYTIGTETKIQADKFTVDNVTYTGVTYNEDGKVKSFEKDGTTYNVTYSGDTVTIKDGSGQELSDESVKTKIATLNGGRLTGVAEAEIENKKGDTLPNTGGIGTKLFYVGGGSMVAVAGIFLITKKRMSRKED